jgi:hypothetical protein
VTHPATADSLIETLVARGEMPASSEHVPPHDGDRPWFIGVVLGAAGWVAGVFVLLFTYLLFEPSTPAGLAVVGAVMIAAALGLYAADRGGAFVHQLALALSIAGQLGLTWAAFQATDSAATTAGLVTALQIMLLAVTPNHMARGLAAFFACIAWAISIRFGWWGETTYERAGAPVPLLPAFVGWLVIWVPLIALTRALIATEAGWMSGPWAKIARPALGGVIVALAVGTWASAPFASWPFSGGSQLTNWLVLWPLLGAFTALFAATAAFRLRDRPLVGIAIAGALLHVGQFYNLLGTTLLVKSAIMFAVGLAFLAAAFALRRQRAARAGGDM